MRSSRWTLIVFLAGWTWTMPTVQGEDYAEFRTRELRCIIGNNAAQGDHRAGYNGIFHLSSVHQPEPVFVPAYAGLNLEHVFDGSARFVDRNILFEPRNAHMSFKKVDERTAELHQPPTPVMRMQSVIRFRLVDPYSIDMEFRCVPHEDVFEGGAFGIFFASYINSPLNKSMYYLTEGGNGPVWQQFCTQFHNHDSTVKHVRDKFDWTFTPGAPTFLFTNISPVRYTEPFFYGRFKNMVLIVMFASPEGIRFAHSPSGGGLNAAKDDTNPAWDFQYIVPNCQIGKEYGFCCRVVYKLWEGREDVLKEYAAYKNTVQSIK
ncbi:MAG: hypothetical protein HPY51_08820 [Candidatus Omnitrophica bacterium]|nr:hypothetical protein [Candidatus Omnitrophota bacterium]